MQLNCKVIKNGTPPPLFLHQDFPLFSGLSPFLAKFLVPLPHPQMREGVPTMKNCIWGITVWSILPFQGSYSYQNFHQKLKDSKAKVSRILPSFHWRLILFSASKVFKKFESQTIWFDLYHPFRKHWSNVIKNTYSKLKSR